MELTKTNENDCITISISEKLTVYDVVSLHHELLSTFETAHQVTVDLKNATDCDSAALQLLIAAKNKAVKQNITFTISNPSEQIKAFAGKIGFVWENLNYQPALC